MLKRTVLALSGAMATLVCAGSAQAQSNSVVRSGDYYEDHANKFCELTTINCSLGFQKTPADKFLTLTNVACFTQTTNSPSSLALNFRSEGGALSQRRLNLPIAIALYVRDTVTSNQVYALSFNIPVKFKMGVSKTPYIEIFAYGPNPNVIYRLDCTITGTLSDPVF